MSLQLPASATIEQAAALAATLPSAAADGSGVLRVDASSLEQLDTSTIALLLQARRVAAERGCGFEVVGAPAKLAALAKLYGVEELLSMSSRSTGA